MKKKHRFLVFIFFSLLIIALSSCKLRAEQKSLMSQFETVDALIDNADYSHALKILKKMENKSYDAWAFIGIYKRYEIMGESKRKARVIKKGLKKNSKNLELNAIYANLLLRQNKMKEAENYCKKLRGTQYGSLYSELYLRNLKASVSPEEFENLSRNKEMFNIYYDAYKGSLNPIWIRNCALFDVEDGQFEKAASLLPLHFGDADDAFFWGMILYDGGRYYDCVNALEISRKFLEDFPDTINRKLNHATLVQQIALESDAYMAVSEMEKAQQQRSILVSHISELNNLSENDENLLSLISLNSAIYANNTGSNDECGNLLKFIVDRWPDLTEGLVLYSDFAYSSSTMREEDYETRLLRQSGLQTVEMEKYDSRVQVPVEDALEKINKSIEQKKNPYLEIVKLDLKYKMNDSYSPKQKTADLWKLLENNYSDEVKFESLLVQYALSYLLRTKQFDDAFELFKKHMYTTYNFDGKEDFWIQVEKSLNQMDVRMAEFAAWFANYLQFPDETIRIYEYVVYESGGIFSEEVVSPYVSTKACMNLADVYYSIGKTDKAIDLYSKAAGRESSSYLRSEIYYRIACIYDATGDKRSAYRTLELATQIYPLNAKANLLKDKIGR